MIEKKHFFCTPLWTEHKEEYLKSLIKYSEPHIKRARKRNAKSIKNLKDFGLVHHSESLLGDNNFLDFKNYIGQKCYDFLVDQDYNMDLYRLMFSEMWVQEFSKNGGGHNATHIHSNQHVCGLYFLKCSKKTSYPVFYDPRLGVRTTKLKNKKESFMSGEAVHFDPVPGSLVIFPGYLEHEFVIDFGKDPFRFIHFNLQAIPKEMSVE